MTSREIAWSALFVALGIAVPILFHAVGLGSTFLPMFLPILAAGLLMRPAPAGLVGLLAPAISALLTGMPPLSPPIAPIMAAEGLALGGVSSMLHRRLGWNPYGAAAVAVAAERATMALLMAALAPLFGVPAGLLVAGALAKGLPGVVLLIVVVPTLVCRLGRILERSHASE